MTAVTSCARYKRKTCRHRYHLEKNRKHQRQYDKHLYRQRRLVENAFAHIGQWRGIATRYVKNAASFVAAINIRCLVMWLKVSCLY